VSIDGNQVFGDDEIVDRLAHRPPPPWYWPVGDETFFDSLALRVDARRIVAYYRARGYFDARVTKTDLRLVGDHEVAIRFRMVEGESTRLAAVELSGVPSAVSEVVRAELAASPVQTGAIFLHAGYVALKDALRLALVARGYAYAKVGGRVVVDREQHAVTVELTVTPGSRVEFGHTEIEGAERVPRSSIRKRIAWRPGEVFDQRLLDETRKRLLAIGVFSGVRLDYPKEGEPERADIRVRVSEGPRNELKLGGGLFGSFTLNNPRVELRGRVSYARKLWLDPLATWRLELRPGYVLRAGSTADRETIEVVGRYERPDFLIYRLGLGVQVGYDIEAYEAYSVIGPRAGVSLDYNLLEQRLVFGVGWQLRDLELVADDDMQRVMREQALGFAPDYRLGLYSQSLAIDLRDDRLVPTLGGYLQLQLEEGVAAAGGALDYLKATTELRAFTPLGDRVVLAARARLGWLGATGDALAPITQRFYGGGPSAHRGFVARQLSPTIELDGKQVVVGGDALALGSAELRIDLTRLADEWLRAGIFADAGDVTADLDQLDLGDLHWAAGLGLRYDTAIGPVRLDIAQRLNRFGELTVFDRLAFHFSVGEAF
jgi:translocation and assembly module TamA